MKSIITGLIVLMALSGCTSRMASAYGGSLAGAAIQENNEQYSGK